MVTQPDDPTQAQAWVRGAPPDAIVDFYIPRGNEGQIGPRGPIGPSLAVGSIVVTNGPAAPGTLGPTGLTGAKGDPGGLVLGTSLSTNDLNTITADGIYRQATSANATLVKNYPMANVIGVMYVNSSSTTAYVQQIFYPGATSASRTFYVRVCSNSVWQPWRAFSSARVDQTAGRAIYQWDDLNQREQLMYGDTGWRELSGVLLNGWTATSVLIRRYNNLVSFKLYNLNPSAATSDIFLGAVTGFVRTHGAGYLLFPKSSTEVAFLSMASTGFQFNPRGAANYGSGGYTEVQWTTTDAWPTVLPGTASGAVPNV